MKIEILYFDGCPLAPQARDNLQLANQKKEEAFYNR